MIDYSRPLTDSYGNLKWIDENGHYHRDNGLPAVEEKSGFKAYYLHGKRHRIDGPAVISVIMNKNFWWLDGKNIDSKEVEDWMKSNGIKTYPFSKEESLFFQLSFS